MAVYTKIVKNDLIKFLKQYELGYLKKFEGILEGIENTNYKIITSQSIFILTIFEKRVKKIDLPFFINLKNHLAKRKFPCPQPISNKSGNYINTIDNKKCVLISYLQGTKAKRINNDHCFQIGSILSQLHNITSDFKQKRTNNLDQKQWKKIFFKCKKYSNKTFLHLLPIIKKELIYLKNNWPNNLPKGIIHADMFQDNVFFKKKKFSGLIDFYFSCNDYLAYDIAITVNAWCFDKKIKFNIKKFQSLLKGYQSQRTLTTKEKRFISVLLRGAAVRILLTRLHDQLFHENSAYVNPKDPLEYEYILKFHQQKNVFDYIK